MNFTRYFSVVLRASSFIKLGNLSKLDIKILYQSKIRKHSKILEKLHPKVQDKFLRFI